jgi:hypothetical protein
VLDAAVAMVAGPVGEDGNQWVAAAGMRPGVGNGGKVGQQVRGFGLLELTRVAVSEVGQGGWDGDDRSAGTGVHPGHEAVETA